MSTETDTKQGKEKEIPTLLNSITTEIRRSELEDLVGECSKLVAAKTMFTVSEKSYPQFPWLTSEELQANVDRLRHSIAELSENGDERIQNRITRAALDIGILGGNLALANKIPDPLDTDPIFKFWLDFFLAKCKYSISKGLKVEDSLLAFKLESSQGYVSDTDPELNCSREVVAKNKMLDYAKERIFPKINFIIVGFRAQLEKWLKVRTSTKFNSNHELVDGFTIPNDGQRIRHVAGMNLAVNAWLMAVGRALSLGLTNDLKAIWKATNDQIQAKAFALDKPFVFCADVGNNDRYFPWITNKYVHAQLLPKWLYEKWLDTYENGVIVGGYTDGEGKKRYYKTQLTPNDNHKPLFSGEGLTSVSNKLVHTANQWRCRWLVYNKGTPTIKEGEAFFQKWFEWMLNNGDDYADFFPSAQERDDYAKLAMSTSWMVIEQEPPSFSGIDFLTESGDRFINVQSKASTLFEKTLETERRGFDNPLASLPYSSIKGKLDFFNMFNTREANLSADIKATYFDMIGLPNSSEEEIAELAEQELKLAEETNGRTKDILKILELLNETDQNVLHWKYSIDDIMAVAPDLVESLFITRPLHDFVDEEWSKELDEEVEYLETLYLMLEGNPKTNNEKPTNVEGTE